MLLVKLCALATLLSDLSGPGYLLGSCSLSLLPPTSTPVDFKYLPMKAVPNHQAPTWVRSPYTFISQYLELFLTILGQCLSLS